MKSTSRVAIVYPDLARAPTSTRKEGFFFQWCEAQEQRRKFGDGWVALIGSNQNPVSCPFFA